MGISEGGRGECHFFGPSLVADPSFSFSLFFGGGGGGVVWVYV